MFGRRIEDCSILYQFFLNQLKNELTEPIGAPNVPRLRLVDMYTSVTDKEVQDCMITSFCKRHPSLSVDLYHRIWHGIRMCISSNTLRFLSSSTISLELE